MSFGSWWEYPVGRAHDAGDNANGGELGIDLATPANTVITTPWAAAVTYVGSSASTGWIVKALTSVPGVGQVYEYFLHLNTVEVSAGQHLAPGSRVGLSGGLQPGAGGWAHVEFGLFHDARYSDHYWGFVTGSTLDPTPVIEALRKGGTHVIPNGWTDDETTLTAPNKVGVVKGFRQYIIGQAWDAEDWPLLPEYTSASIEPGNPAIGPGSRQDFRKGSLGYTEKMGVYRIWIGQDYEAQQQSIAQLRAQVATLEAELSKGDKADAALRALKDALASVA